MITVPEERHQARHLQKKNLKKLIEDDNVCGSRSKQEVKNYQL